jgi:hypothetical protein
VRTIHQNCHTDQLILASKLQNLVLIFGPFKPPDGLSAKREKREERGGVEVNLPASQAQPPCGWIELCIDHFHLVSLHTRYSLFSRECLVEWSSIYAPQ